MGDRTALIPNGEIYIAERRIELLRLAGNEAAARKLEDIVGEYRRKVAEAEVAAARLTSADPGPGEDWREGWRIGRASVLLQQARRKAVAARQLARMVAESRAAAGRVVADVGEHMLAEVGGAIAQLDEAIDEVVGYSRREDIPPGGLHLEAERSAEVKR